MKKLAILTLLIFSHFFILSGSIVNSKKKYPFSFYVFKNGRSILKNGRRKYLHKQPTITTYADRQDLRVHRSWGMSTKKGWTQGLCAQYNARSIYGTGKVKLSFYFPQNQRHYNYRPKPHNLRPARYLLFYMRGRKGGEIIRTSVGGKFNYARSFPIMLEKKWRLYSLDLRYMDRSKITFLFNIIFNKKDTPAGATIYLHDVHYSDREKANAIPVNPAISSKTFHKKTYLPESIRYWENKKIKQGLLLQYRCTINKILCHPWSLVSFYRNGRLKMFFPFQEIYINKIPCQAGTRVTLYKNGKLKEAILARGMIINKEYYSAGQVVSFTKRGKIRKFFHEIGEGVTPKEHDQQYRPLQPAKKKIKKQYDKYYIVKNGKNLGPNHQSENITPEDKQYRGTITNRKAGFFIKYKPPKKNKYRATGIEWNVNKTAVAYGLNLEQYTKLYIIARGKKGGEKVYFTIGGRHFFNPYNQAFQKDSCKISYGPITLTKQWKTYVIDLTKYDMRSLDIIFEINFMHVDHPRAATIYLKNVYYQE